MESYARHYFELVSVKKRKKQELEEIQKKLNVAKLRLFTSMKRCGVEEVDGVLRVNGRDVQTKVKLSQIQPKEKIPRKKKAEVERDLQIVLENRGIDRANEVVKELETVRKSKQPLVPLETPAGGSGSGKNNKQQKHVIGEVLYS